MINIRTNQDYPDRFRAEVSLDLLDGSALVQGRVGKDRRWGLTAAGRRSWIDAFVTPLAGGAGFTVRPYWWDYQFKMDDLKKPDGKFSVLLMGFGDKLFFGSPADVAQGTDPDTQGDADVYYGSHRLIAQYYQDFSDELTLRFTPSIGYDSIGFALGNSFIFDQVSWLTEVRADLLWSPSDILTLRPGVDLLAGPYDVGITLPLNPEQLTELDPVAEREDFRVVFEGSFLAVDPFIEAWIKPFDGTDKLNLVPGLRFNYLALPYYSIWSVDPRFTARFSPFENTTLKAGTGLYHQPPQGPDLGFNETDIRVDYERSWSSEVGIEQKFGDAIETDLTFFYKLDELIIENENWVTSDPFFVNGGEGRVRGMESAATTRSNFFGWISYTLSSAERYAVPLEDRENGRQITAKNGARSSSTRPTSRSRLQVRPPRTGRLWTVPVRDRRSLRRLRTACTTSTATPTTKAAADDRIPPFYALDLRVDKTSPSSTGGSRYRPLGCRPRLPRRSTAATTTRVHAIRGLPCIPSVGLRAEQHLIWIFPDVGCVRAAERKMAARPPASSRSVRPWGGPTSSSGRALKVDRAGRSASRHSHTPTLTHQA